MLNVFRSCYLNRWFCKFWYISVSTIDLLGPGQHGHEQDCGWVGGGGGCLREGFNSLLTRWRETRARLRDCRAILLQLSSWPDRNWTKLSSLANHVCPFCGANPFCIHPSRARCGIQQINNTRWSRAKICKCDSTSWAGPDGYPRVLDYSIFEFTTLPYSKNLTTRSSSRVVTICTLFAQTLENPAMTNENYQKSFTFFVWTIFRTNT